MQELCLAIGLVAASVGGLEYVATVAVNWATELAQADDLEDLLDLDMGHPEIALDVDFDAAADSDPPPAPPAATERR